MTLTVRVFNYLPQQQPVDWKGVTSDRIGFRRYEKEMGSLSKIVTLIFTAVFGVFTCGAYFIYLGYSQTGCEEWENIKNNKFIYYVKDPQSALAKNNHISLPASAIKGQLPKTAEQYSKSYLKWLSQLYDQKANWKTVVDTDLNHKDNFNEIANIFPFDASNESCDQLVAFHSFLEKSPYKELLKSFNQKIIDKGLQQHILAKRPRNQLDGAIVSIQRLKPYLKSTFKTEGPTNCFIIDKLDKQRFGLKITPPCLNSVAIMIKGKGANQEIWVNADEFDSRLMLNDVQVLCEANQGSLKRYIEKEKTVLIWNNFQRILNKIEKFQLKKYKSKITPDVLICIVKAALNSSHEDLKKTKGKGMTVNPSHPMFTHLAKALTGMNLIVGINNNKVYIRDISHPGVIKEGGVKEGGEVIVSQVQTITSNKTQIIKQYKSRGSNENLQALGLTKAFREFNIIEELHHRYSLSAEGTLLVPGIVKRFHGIVPAKDGAIILEDYFSEGTLRHAIDSRKFSNIRERVLAFSTLIEGFAWSVGHLGLGHKDIKPSNIFVGLKPGTKKVNLYLADFEGAIIWDSRKEYAPTDLIQDLVLTYQFVSRQDVNACTRLQSKIKELLKSERNRESYKNELMGYINDLIKHIHAWDVFSWGCVLGYLITGKEDCIRHDSDKTHPYALPGTFQDSLVSQDSHMQSLVNLIKRMVESDPTQRITISEVKNELLRIIKAWK